MEDNKDYVFDSSDEEQSVNEVIENKEITNPQPVEVETITRVKKPRTEKQIAALEKARKTRAIKIEEKKKMKEAESKLIEENYEYLKATAIGETPTTPFKTAEELYPLPQEYEEVVETPNPPILRPKVPKKEKKKKVKKVIVNNYYEESSDEEIVEEQNNYYRGKKKKGSKLQPAPAQQPHNIEYEEEVLEENYYSYNPYGNITFC